MMSFQSALSVTRWPIVTKTARRQTLVGGRHSLVHEHVEPGLVGFPGPGEMLAGQCATGQGT